MVVAVVVVVVAPRLARGLTFAPCEEAGQEAFECAALAVPLDYLARTGTIQLHVQRLVRPVQPAGLLIALAGGPGQSATLFASLFAEKLASLLEGRQLVVFDQRGTGLSGALDCRLPNGTMPSTKRCATRLGSDRRYYATGDSVRDLDAVRDAMGAERVAVYGVSYGTLVTSQYGRTFPERVDRLILDSSLPSEPDPVERPTFAAIPRVLADLCAGGACAGITADPNRDLDQVLHHARRGLRATVPDSGGKRRRKRVRPQDLYEVLLTGDTLVALRAFLPSALAAERAGDADPLGRLLFLTEASGAAAPSRQAEDDDLRDQSDALTLATSCLDNRFPWGSEAPMAVRRHATRSFLRTDVAPGSFSPFTSDEAVSVTNLGRCRSWPETSRFDALTTAPFGPAPVLIMEGSGDLRTPIESTDELLAMLPGGLRVIVPGAGHFVLPAECVQEVLVRFDRGEDPGDACDGNKPTLGLQPVPPRSLHEVPPAGAPGRAGRTANAALLTIRDALAAVVAISSDAPGIRHGWARMQDARDSFLVTLDAYSLVPGVHVDGELVVQGPALTTLSRQLQQLVEFEAGVLRHAPERGRAESDGVMVCERQLPSLSVAIDATGAALSDEHETGPLERAKHPPGGKIGHQAATITWTAGERRSMGGAPP